MFTFKSSSDSEKVPHTNGGDCWNRKESKASHIEYSRS